MTEPLLTIAQLARRLNRSRQWLYDHLDELYAKGFPKKVPIVGRWHPAAVDAWLAKQVKMPDPDPLAKEREEADAAFGLVKPINREKGSRC